LFAKLGVELVADANVDALYVVILADAIKNYYGVAEVLKVITDGKHII